MSENKIKWSEFKDDSDIENNSGKNSPTSPTEKIVERNSDNTGVWNKQKDNTSGGNYTGRSDVDRGGVKSHDTPKALYNYRGYREIKEDRGIYIPVKYKPMIVSDSYKSAYQYGTKEHYMFWRHLYIKHLRTLFNVIESYHTSNKNLVSPSFEGFCKFAYRNSSGYLSEYS